LDDTRLYSIGCTRQRMAKRANGELCKAVNAITLSCNFPETSAATYKAQRNTPNTNPSKGIRVLSQSFPKFTDLFTLLLFLVPIKKKKKKKQKFLNNPKSKISKIN